MSNAPSSAISSNATARRFFAIQELLSSPELARFYTDFLVNTPTTVPAARDRLGLSKSTAYKYVNRLEELGISEELDRLEGGSSLWRTDPVSGSWTDDGTAEFGPAVIAVYGATIVDDDLELFVDRHGKAALAPAVTETVEYLKGNTTRRGVADTLGVPAVEGIAISEAIERIVAVAKDHDPALRDAVFEVEIHDRAVERAPYRRADE